MINIDNKDQRNFAIIVRRRQGLKYREIAEEFGISTPWAQQIYKKFDGLPPPNDSERNKLSHRTRRKR